MDIHTIRRQSMVSIIDNYKSMVKARMGTLPDTNAEGWLETVFNILQAIAVITLCMKAQLYALVVLLALALLAMILYAIIGKKTTRI